MSHSWYFEIHRVNPDELPPSFADAKSFAQFAENREPRLIFDAQGGDVFVTFESCIKHLGLTGLAAFDLDRYDQMIEGAEMGTLYLRRPSMDEMDRARQDILKLREIASSTPNLLVFEPWQYPDLQAEHEKYIAECASTTIENVLETDVCYYDSGEFWDHFFWVLEIVCTVVDEAKEAGQAILFVWYCS